MVTVMSNPDGTTREDPYGEFSHVKPVLIAEAAHLLREATRLQGETNSALIKARAEVSKYQAQKLLIDKQHEEATHRLHISALVQE
jgi:hypothetical protein